MWQMFYLRNCSCGLVRDRTGSIAIIFALVLPLLCAGVGVAIDYGRATFFQKELQSAIDAAVLAASNPMVADANRKKIFDGYLQSNFAGASDLAATKYNYTLLNGGRGSATLSLNNFFMGIGGFPTTDISVSSGAKFDGTNLEIVFVFDVSGSMAGARLSSVQTAAVSLISKLKSNVSDPAALKFGLVPFNMAVNIGMANSGLVTGTNHALFAGSGWGGCVLERPNGKHHLDDYNPGNTDGTGRWPAYLWPPEPDTGGMSANPSNGTNDGYARAEPWPLPLAVMTNGPNYNCPRHPIVQLTDNQSTIETAITDLTSESNQGTTFGPAVSWAMRTLSPGAPFTEGAAYSANVRKIIVLLTDGDQVNDGYSGAGGANSVTPYEFDPTSLGLQGKKLTMAPLKTSFSPYGYLLDSDPYNQGLATSQDANLELDRLSLQACTEAKNQGASKRPIEIYSIAAGTGAGPGTRAYTALSACATSSAHMFYAADETQLAQAFDGIGKDISTLRLVH